VAEQAIATEAKKRVGEHHATACATLVGVARPLDHDAWAKAKASMLDLLTELGDDDAGRAARTRLCSSHSFACCFFDTELQGGVMKNLRLLLAELGDDDAGRAARLLDGAAVAGAADRVADAEDWVVAAMRETSLPEWKALYVHLSFCLLSL
jgi:hypothetical protein